MKAKILCVFVLVLACLNYSSVLNSSIFSLIAPRLVNVALKKLLNSENRCSLQMIISSFYPQLTTSTHFTLSYCSY